MESLKNLSFVILHYQAIETTKKCIESINKLETMIPINIVVVDNASPNNSGKILKEIYSSFENVYVLLNSKNEGFSKGNNFGYQFAKRQLQSNIIVVMNNDVMIEQKDFIELLCGYSKDNKVQILAPDIITLNKQHQNPVRREKVSNKELMYIYIYNSIMKYLYLIPLINHFILYINNKRPRISKRTYQKCNEIIYNIVPHGSCVIYLSSWIKEEDFAFIPDTFMFCEEDILFEYINKKGYKTMYIPNIWVKHLEDASISTVSKTELSRQQFKSKNASFSSKVLIKMRNKTGV